MAAQFGQATDRVSRSGAVPDPASGFTVLGWARVDADTNLSATLARVWTAGMTTVATFATSSDGLGGPNYFTGGGSVSSSIGFVPGEWRRVAFTCLGTTAEVYAATPTGPVEVDSGTVSVGTPAGITLGGRDTGDGSENLIGTLAYWRVFAARLTQSQIEAEWASPQAVASAWADWPLIGDLNDISGNARHLVAGTTPVDFVTGHPLPSAATAVLAGTLPLPVLAATAEVVAAAALAGSTPLPQAALTAEAQATAPVGTATAVLNAVIPLPRAGTASRVSVEMAYQRKITHEFIMASPVEISLTPNEEVRTPSGAVSMVAGTPRPAQVFRLIPMSHTGRPASSTGTGDGLSGDIQRRHDLTILGEWDAVVHEGDFWEGKGGLYVVDEVIPFNGYEVKGLVTFFGRRGSIVA